MKKITIAQVDAFTTKLFGGNPAGVVLDANELTDEEMQKIAREMNLSETAFVLKSNKADFKLRYFTPTTEVKFCGHATVGTLYALAQNNLFGMNSNKNYIFHVETNIGILKMSVQKNTNPTILFAAPETHLEKSPVSFEQLATVLGIAAKFFDTKAEMLIDKKNRYLYATINNLKTLGEIHYDYQKTKDFSQKHNIILIVLLTTDTFDPKNTVHIRVFAPSIGIIEDPVTGSAQGGVAMYLFKNNMIPKSTKQIFSEQGHFIKRPGKVKIEIHFQENKFFATVIAQAVMVFQTEIEMK